ncbi:MAG TPA: hypothetical protein VKA63_11735 [Candidatus Krumholzibacteria bacterium]|nr:hypothetical protein [Candidatus Krumholzibacteria bacterium]
MKTVLALVLSLALVISSLFLGAGCGGDDDVTGGGDGMHGVYFTSNNAPYALSYFASVLDLTISVNRAKGVLLAAVDAASNQKRVSALGQVDLGDLGLCDTGQSHGVWNDSDGDGILSVGDSIELTATDCDDISRGTLTLVVLSITGPSVLLDVTVDLTINEIENQQTHTTHIMGHYACAITAEGDPVSQIVVQDMVAEQTDSASQLSVTLDGVQLFTIGCFNLYYIVDPGYSSFRLSEPLVVFKVPGQGVMSLGAYGLPMLVFDGNGVPISGQVEFWAESFATPCSALGIPSGGVDANDSHFSVTANGNGSFTITGQTDSGAPFSFDVQWDDIH